MENDRIIDILYAIICPIENTIPGRLLPRATQQLGVCSTLSWLCKRVGGGLRSWGAEIWGAQDSQVSHFLSHNIAGAGAGGAWQTLDVWLVSKEIRPNTFLKIRPA